jgi:type IV fimbrial biogenesis protein FimT
MKKQGFIHGGFTLIELMITISIAAILLAVASPNLSAYKRNSELTSAANKLISSINAARGEAMKRGRNAMLVPTNNGTSWNTGWTVFVDKDRSQTFDESSDVTVSIEPALPSYINVSANRTASESPAYIMFNASGYPTDKSGSAGGNLTLTITRTDVVGATPTVEQTRRIKVAVSGRVRACKPISITDVNCDAN